MGSVIAMCFNHLTGNPTIYRTTTHVMSFQTGVGYERMEMIALSGGVPPNERQDWRGVGMVTARVVYHIRAVVVVVVIVVVIVVLTLKTVLTSIQYVLFLNLQGK